MSEFILSLSGWDKNGNVYTYPGTKEGNNWYDIGLVPKNDFTADLYNWYGFAFETEVHGQMDIEVKVGLLDFGEVHSYETVDYYTWKTTVFGDGKMTITAPTEQFDIYTGMPAKWRFLRSIEINCNAENLRAIKGKSVCIDADILSKPAEADEVICYDLTVANCTGKKQAVKLGFKKTGYEVTEPILSQSEFILEPYEEKQLSISVKMSDRVTPGGFEKHMLYCVPNGDGSQTQELEFYSVRHLPHPYIICTEDNWKEVKKKISKYDWAKKIADTYIQRAEEWSVPEVSDNKAFMFVTDEGHKCCNSAIAWKLCGKREYAENAAEFLRRLSRPVDGYLDRMKGSNQQLVHEGEFFKSCAKAYDLIHDCGVLSEEDHENIKKTFRRFIEFLDWALSDGGISNWSLAEIAGAMYCSMAVQDRERIERFVFGKGGAMDHLRAGVYSDGWWCECTIGYNQMAAGLFSEYTVALRPWGINIADWWVPAQYSNRVHFRNQHADGLCWDIYGENTRNYRSVVDLWDSLVAMANYRAVVQGVNDSAEERFSGASPVAFDSRYDIAYAIYKKPEYANIIKNAGPDVFRDLFYGVGELPDVESDAHRQSYYFNNGGISLLRSRTEGRDDSEQFEISLKYGSHGGAHGHYDRCALNAVSRFGKALFNPENIWYSYGTFMYKFFVQNSITHNMVTTDLKLQDPQEGRQCLFHSGKVFNASAVENKARWSNPPYGGWRVFSDEEFEDRTWIEGRYVPIPENHPPYAERSEYTEPVMQRRLAVLTDDYVVCFDSVRGESEHKFDCIYHLPGLVGIDGDKLTEKEHSEQLTENPLSSAQFITGVDRYESEGTVKLSFSYEYDEKISGKAPWIVIKQPAEPKPFRSGHNVPGVLNTDLYYAADGENELIIGCDPEFYPVSKRLFYSVEGDDKTIAEGAFGAWILGRDHIEADVDGIKQLKLHTRTENGKIDHHLVGDTLKTIFWGNPYFETADGQIVYLSDMDYSTENIDNGNGVGIDYAGGPVRIQDKLFVKAVPGDVIDNSKEGIITIDISKFNAVKFVSDIGGDYPVGDESERRRFIAQRKTGKNAEFVSILEPYTDKKMIKKVDFISNSEIRVELNDGREQHISVEGLNGSGNDICVKVDEYLDGKLVRTESAKGIEK